MGSLDGVAVAVRVRRLWTGTLGPLLAARGHDLGDVWQDTALIRRGLILDLVTPINFGLGDPFADGTGAELEARLGAATDGAVRQVRWRFAGGQPKPLRRAASTELDVFHPGDPTSEVLPEVAEEVARRLGKGACGDAAAVLSRLTVAAVSQHRLWLAAPDAAAGAALAATPGAAFALRDAVRRWQRKDPLYSVHVDPLVAAASPSLVVPA